MNEEQIVELGSRAEALLGSKTFKFVVDYLANSYANNILQSAVPATEAREQNYYLHRALADIVGQLAGFTQAKDEIMSRRSQEEEDSE